MFRSYLPHPNSKSCTIFLWTLCSSRNILSKFQIFSQLARPIPKALVQLETMTEHTRLFYSFLPHPSLELHTISFFGFLIIQGILCQNLRIFLNRSTGWATGSSSFFFRRSPVGNRFIGSSGLLANGSVFSIFCALVQAGLSPSAPDGLGGWFYV